MTTLEGAKQTIAMGPVASQEVIKELGTNGGGFFNANSAHPFENPTPLTNFFEMMLIFADPRRADLHLRPDGQGPAAGLGASSPPWRCSSSPASPRPTGPSRSPTRRSRGLAGRTSPPATWKARRSRFGVANSALFATVTTDASCGAVNSMHDSFTPLGGLVPLVNIQLGEVIFGGVGAGLYGMLVFVVLSVFIAGLMVGRTPEYLGKKIEAREMKLRHALRADLPADHPGLRRLGGGDAATGLASLNNAGPHGLTEILYAYTSGAGNNGSAFAGLNANTPWWNITLGLTMLAGRFLMIVPVLAIAGSMVGKKTVPAGPGHVPHQRPAVHRAAGRRGDHRRRPDLLPGADASARSSSTSCAAGQGF